MSKSGTVVMGLHSSASVVWAFARVRTFQEEEEEEESANARTKGRSKGPLIILILVVVKNFIFGQQRKQDILEWIID